MVFDIDWGDYPYVTSSHCTTAGALLNGIPPQAINRVWGAAKVYETYVGAKNFQGDDPLLEQLQEAGQEFGATTGRKRQTNWIDLDFLAKSCRMNGVTDLVINKMDVMREVMGDEEWESDFRHRVSSTLPNNAAFHEFTSQTTPILFFHRRQHKMIAYKVKVWPSGSKEWYLNGKQHREDGPAVERANGTKVWYLNGKLHREDGPAVE